MKTILSILFLSLLILAPLQSYAQSAPSSPIRVTLPSVFGNTGLAKTSDSGTYDGHTNCGVWNSYDNVFYSCKLSDGTVENYQISRTGLPTDACTPTTCTVTYEIDKADGTYISSGTNTAAAAAIKPTGAVIAAVQPPQTQSNSCNLGLNVLCDLTQGLAGILQNVIFAFMEVTSFILGIVGVLFNWLVVITIFQFGVFFGNSQGMLLAWGILRDVGNILILFGFLYAGVMMVLDLHSFDARKAIPRLIIFAVLLNFSLFAGEAIVDVANVLSAKIYQEAGQSIFQKCDSATSLTNCTNQVGIAEVIIQDTGLGGAYSYGTGTAASGAVNTNHPGDVHVMLAFVGVTILMSIVIILLLAASIMFLLRAITLVILLVTSPIGFAGFAIPQLESQARKWWETLISNAFFAPIFLLLLFVGLKVMDGLRASISGSNTDTLISALSNPNTSVGSILIVFALIVGFFIAALMFAKSSGTAGASFATTWAQKTVTGAWGSVGNTAGGAARWGYGLGARNTVGKYVPKLATTYNQKMGEWKAKPGLSGKIAKGTDYLVGDQLTGSLSSFSKKKFGGIRSFDEAKAHEKHRDHETHTAADKVQQVKDLNTYLAEPRGAFVPGTTIRDVNDPVEKKRNKKIADQLAKMDKEKLNEVLKSADKAVNGNFDDILRNLSKKKYDERVEDHNFDHDLKHIMEDRRFSPENAPRTLQNMKPEEKVKLPTDILILPHVMANLNPRDFATFDPKTADDDVIDAIRAHVQAHPTDPKVVEFLGLIGDPRGLAALTNTPMKNRWSGVVL